MYLPVQETQETQVQSLSWDAPLEEGIAIIIVGIQLEPVNGFFPW